jgi:hypothetical protein
MHCWRRYRCALALGIAIPLAHAQNRQIGQEVAIPQHLQNGQEFQTSLTTLLEFGRQLFAANWTIQEGQGRPLAKGVGTPTLLSDLSSPLVFPRNFNRLSAPDANSCAGCHNVPIPGGAGDIVANVFVLGQRFDSITLDHSDAIPTRGALDENGNFATALNFADSRATPGMFGSGYLELLGREITADLRATENTRAQRGRRLGHFWSDRASAAGSQLQRRKQSAEPDSPAVAPSGQRCFDPPVHYQCL